ncbi:chromate transporter [Gammaproteobacteria bacterium]
MAGDATAHPIPPVSEKTQVSLWFLLWNFLKIGSVAFGGFMSLIAVVQNLVVERHRLLTQEDMLDGISLATILPGPVAVNVVAYVGYRLRGGLGALISAVAVTLPAFLLIIVLTIAYFKWGQLPAVSKAFAGFIPAMTAIIVITAWNMGQKAVKGKGWAALFITVSAALFLLMVGGFFSTLAIVACSGGIGWLLYGRVPNQTPVISTPTATFSGFTLGMALLVLLAVLLFALVPVPGVSGNSPTKLLITFSGMSLMLFGSGYVFIPLMQESVVNNMHWVTQQEFVDAIAMGQITPGPILISAAFVGYKVAGWIGALAATVGIFAPAALLMVSGSLVLERIKHSPVVNAALKGIRPAVVGLICAAAFAFGRTATVHWASLLIFAITLWILLRLRIDMVWVIPAAGLLGLFLY